MSTYFNIKNDPILNPPGNVSLGSASNPYQNIYTTGNLVVGNSSFSSDSLNVPKISAISYIGNDTAADTAGGQTVTLTGTGFVAGAQVIINQSYASVVTVVNSTTMTFVTPAQSTGSYILYLVNPDGGTAIAVPGIQYSGVPAWSTSAGSLGSVTELSAINNTVTATGDAPITYSLFSGTLPPGATLNANGTVTGTSVVTNSPTTYSFTVRSTDAQNQDTDRTFSITVNPDVVTWSSPADGTNYNLTADQSISPVTLSATAASGRSVSYSANTLPTGVSLSGDTISGTPTTTSNVSTLLTATSSTTNRSATRTITWTVSVGGDTSWSYVTTLLSATALTLPFNNDASTNNFAVTVVGDTRPNNFGPYTAGYYSNYFDGTGDYLSTPAGLTTTMGTGYSGNIVSIECWIYPTSFPSGNSYITGTIGSYAAVSANGRWYFGFVGSAGTTGNLRFVYTTGTGSEDALVTTSNPIILNQWNHIAVTIDATTNTNTTVKLFANGTLQNTFTGKNFTTQTAYYGAPTIGGNFSQYVNDYVGQISNLRILTGAFAYTTNYTVPTQPLTAITNTSLLTCQSNRLIDTSTNNFTITRNGDVSVSGFDPFAPASNTATFGSGYFDGTGDYLSLASSSAFNFGAANFTVEAWYYFTALPGSGTNDTLYTFGNYNPYLYLWGDGTIILRSAQTSGDIINVSHGFVVNQWYHIAVVKTGTSFVLYRNGSVLGSGTSSAIVSENKSLEIGGQSTFGFTGYMSDFRTVNGTAVYTSAFTPPTSPLTAIANTSLLTLQTNQPANNNAFLDSSTNNFLVTRNGNTTQGSFSPYGPLWSNYFDGTGDYLTVANNTALSILSGSNFTIESWIYLTATPAPNSVIVQSSSVSNGYVLRVSSALQVNWVIPGVAGYGFGPTLSLNTWYHVAVCRVGTTVTGYVNGTQYTFTSSNRTADSGQPTAIGGDNHNSASYFTGYISNLRIIKNEALYTANFTPSTSPLTAVANTSLLTCTDNRFIDDSPNNFTITRNGDVSVQRFSPFSPQTVPTYYSGYFDGTGDFLRVDDNILLQLESSSFTIEAWIYPMASGQISICSKGAGGSNGFSFYKSSTEKLAFTYSASTLVASSSSLALNTWSHVAAVREGTGTNQFKLYINGQLEATSTVAYNFNQTNQLLISYGRNGSTGVEFNGYISNLRIVKGTAVYTSAFTPSTTPLTAIANTSLLTCQRDTFIDTSTNNFAITVDGNSTPRTVAPFTPTATAGVAYSPSVYGGSLYYRVRTDSLGVPANTLVKTFPGDFTFEAWVYPTDTSVSNWGLWDGRQDGQTPNPMVLNINPLASPVTGQGRLGYYNGTQYYGTGIVYYNTWSHIAWVRSGSTMTFYVNGIAGGTATISGTQTSNATTNPIFIGNKDQGAGASFGTVGYISDLKVNNGRAVYTSNFAPPVAPLTATQNSVLLLNGTGAGVYDMSMMNDYETVGNSSLVTNIEKYGNSSLYFDGSVDYLYVPNNVNYQFGTGNYTVEFWLNMTSFSGQNTVIIDFRTSNGATGGAIQLYVTSAGIVTVYGGSSTSTLLVTAGSAISTATWAHIALTRSSNSTQLFINGTQSGSTATDSTSYSLGALWIGSNASGGGNYLTGYIDDFRITKGVARYTTTFTPTSSPFFVK